MRQILLLIVLIASTAVEVLAQSGPFPAGTKRVLFLGNSITYAGMYVTDVETYLLRHYPNLSVEFINAGLPSETVSGLSEPNHADGRFPRPDLRERLDRVLAQTKPDMVFACYGMNDGIYLPLDEARFRAYRDGIKWLHTELEKAGAKRIIFLTPPVHDDAKLGLQGYNLTLDTYANWLLAQRDSLHWDVADLHFPMNRYLTEKRTTDPAFKLASDGVHVGELGHWLMARQILQFLGENVSNAPDLQAALPAIPRNPELLEVVKKRQGIMKDAWLNVTGHKRPGMAAGLPMPEARRLYEDLDKQIRAILAVTK
jgi:lysophospholipase L1-like esterase